MTREEGKVFANALKNNYTIDFDKLPEFCDLVVSALEKNESAEEWYKVFCEKLDSVENKGEWISVSEKNPGIGEHVLVCLKDGYIDTDDYYSYGFDDWKHLVVAWQPLPEPYKGVTNE